MFTAFGDQGVSQAAAANDHVILRQKPAFHLHAGDICYADTNGQGKKSDGYDPAFWDLFLKQNEPVARSVPWMVTTGNHDMEAWYSPEGYGGQLARWSLPDSGFDGRTAPGVYAFTYGNVGFVALDANDVSYEIPANFGYSGGKQTKWLDRKLAQLRAAKDVDFVVVFFHHCAYSTSAHASDGGVRAEWLPLFAKHQVDLVINGHNHVYERTDAIKDGGVGRNFRAHRRVDRSDARRNRVRHGGRRRPGPVRLPGGREGELRGTRHAPRLRRHLPVDEGEGLRDGDRGVVAGALPGFLAALGGGAQRPRPALKVSALTDDGRRIDHFEVRRGA